MSARAARARLVLKVAAAGVLGALVGLAAGYAGLAGPRSDPAPADRTFPLPHHIPKYPGGITLRFAMVHDVLHERFPFHGAAYYAERNRRARKALDAGADLEHRFTLVDDLAVGLERLGQYD